ncbi:hypothetical protein M9H77_32942 [Catharanthus roseus]|uniref:Uncharacterized protein n=1 Tax=Catharanthus roseus TaxID=4058 RepID=A0ACC0A5R8_CATRO|nr:hypothetical protein M9H77_32942 [Catharanthus roseus]
MAIGAPSRFDSVSSSDESDDQTQGRVDIASGSRTRIDSSSENDSPGDENLENGETRKSISEYSIEEYSSEFEDTDYEGDRSDSSQSVSDDQGYSSEENLEVDEHDVVEDRKRKAKDVLEDELDADKHNLVENKKRKPANVHEESGKKKKVLDEDIQIGDNIKRVEEVRKSRLERLRYVSEHRKKELESGEPSTRIRVNFDGEGNNESNGSSDSDHFVQKSSRKGSRDVQKQSKRKSCDPNDIDFMNILADSIWDKCDDLKEMLPPLKEKTNALPLKFRFEDEDPVPPEKTEEEIEVENLFTDLAMGWTEDDIGAPKTSKESENDNAAEAEVTDPTERCRLGYHFLILDEEIGVICKYCGIVHQEIKHSLPDLKIPSWRRYDQFKLHNGEGSVSYGFQFEEATCGDDHPLMDAEGPVLDLIPTYLRRQMYPHQLDGFQFLWKNIAGATMIEDIRIPLPEDGTGCIISHAPGTGKTFLTILFILTFMKVHPTCHPMIMAPLTMLRAWANELKRWNVNIPFHNLNDPELSGEENAIAASIIQRVGSSKKGRRQHKDYKRMVKLYSWTKDRSILGIGYDLFEKLAGEHSKGDHGEKFRKILLELPGILFLDEGHTPRNQNSQLWKALTKVKTGRRIILSGTPFQNNFDELYNTFCLVNQKFSEDISIETCRNRAIRKNNLAKGKWASLTNLINKNADDAVEELRAMMDPFVHVHKGTILQESLPGLRDTLVVLNPTDLQQKLLTRIPEDCFLERMHLLSMISVHPSLVAQNKLFSDQKNFLEQLKTRPEAGVKTQFVIEIVRLSKARGEKVLIFSEYLDPLRFLMKHLASYFSWEEGKQVLYMDGAMDEKQRQLVIHSLNNNESESQVLLASTKACSEGINLVGASRVVLLDVVWNPSVERQAISRAYRLGQKKFVYVYHLITSKTLEVDKYQRQAKKDRISERVFSSPYEQNHRSDISKIVSGDNILEAMVHHEKLKHIFEKILHQPRESNIFENFNFVCSEKQ